ncbi:MAG: FHA domain-containing protein [Bacteroides sp.]|nr:FHA domain-containing protein [Bacteroides sp.]
MTDLIRIKCPFDGAVLTVVNQPGLETKSVTCPICKHKYPFTQFKRISITAGSGDPETDYDGLREHTEYTKSNQAGSAPQLNYVLGRLRRVGTGESFQLKPGRNVIGRKAMKSTADFMIDTGAERTMSREHILIEIKSVPGKGMVHYLSLYKDKINPTYVGGEQLYYGDCIVLNSNKLINLPGVDLIFEIPDEEKTTM